jgi:amino acid permease
MSDNLEISPPLEEESQSASQETTPLLEKSATRDAKEIIGFPCVFIQSHVFSFLCHVMVGPDLFAIVSQVVESTGTGRTLLALSVSVLLTLAIIRNHIQMLRLWPIQSNTAIFTQNYVDPWLGVVIGWLPCFMYSCWYAGMTVQRTTLVNALGLGRTGDSFTHITTSAVPVLFALIPNEWLKHSLGWLVAVRLLVASAILIIMVYVNESIAHSQSRFALRENATFSGGLVHKYITGTMYAIYMLSRICFGLDALSSVAPEMTVESPGLRESDEGSVSTGPRYLDKY